MNDRVARKTIPRRGTPINTVLCMTASPPAFAPLLTGLSIYLATGLVTALVLLIAGNRGLGSLDSHALRNADGRATLGFRVFIFPGLIVFWPLVLLRFAQARRQAKFSFAELRARERAPHISSRHRVSTILLLIFIPPLFVLAVFQARSGEPPAIEGDDPYSAIRTNDAAAADSVAEARVSLQLDDVYVPRLDLTLDLRRHAATANEARRYWLHTSAGADPLPPDTLLYWLPSTASENEMNSAYLLGPLPAGPGRLPVPDGASDPATFATNPGIILGYSLAHQKILFRIPLRARSQ